MLRTTSTPRTSLHAAFAAIFSAALLVGCSGKPETWQLDGSSMGTTYSVQTVGKVRHGARLTAEIKKSLEQVETLFSTYLPESEVSRFNASRSTEWFLVSENVCQLIERSLSFSVRSSGAFDITIAPLVNAWGFGPDFDVHGIPPATEVQRLLDETGHHRLQTDCGSPAIRKNNPELTIDLSGIAKGYAVDALASTLDRHGVKRYLVEIGGEILARGNSARGAPWAVAIEHPVDPVAAPPIVIHLVDGAVATSGDYRNFVEVDGKRYSHTIDPRDGYPVSHELTAVTVVDASAADADALATALLVLGPDAGIEFAERESIAAAFLIRQSDALSVRKSTTFDARTSAPAN